MHKKKAWSNQSCRLVDRPKSSPLLLLPRWMSITGYHTTRKTSYSQWLATEKQEIRYRVPGASKSRREKTTTNGIYSWQFKYVNVILTVLCIINVIICAYITGIHDKRIVTSCTTWHLPQTIRVFRLLSSILSANNFAIIYAADNL